MVELLSHILFSSWNGSNQQQKMDVGGRIKPLGNSVSQANIYTDIYDGGTRVNTNAQ